MIDAFVRKKIMQKKITGWAHYKKKNEQKRDKEGVAISIEFVLKILQVTFL
jgi:hypothetical protein